MIVAAILRLVQVVIRVVEGLIKIVQVAFIVVEEMIRLVDVMPKAVEGNMIYEAGNMDCEESKLMALPILISTVGVEHGTV